MRDLNNPHLLLSIYLINTNISQAKRITKFFYPNEIPFIFLPFRRAMSWSSGPRKRKKKVVKKNRCCSAGRQSLMAIGVVPNS